MDFDNLSYSQLAKRTNKLLAAKKFERAFDAAQALLNKDDSKIMGYVLFAKSCIGKEDYLPAILCCAEGLEKDPNNTELQELFFLAKKKKREKEEEPIIANEALASTNPSWSFILDDSISDMQFSPASNVVLAITSDSGDIKLVNTNGDSIFRETLTTTINACAWSPTGTDIAVCCQDGTLRAWFGINPVNKNNPKFQYTYSVGSKRDWVENIVWLKTPKGEEFIICSIEKHIHVCQVDRTNQATPITSLRAWNKHTTSIQALIWTATYGLLSFSNKEIYLWDISKEDATDSMNFDAMLSSQTVGGNDGSLVMIGRRDGLTMAWDIRASTKAAIVLPRSDRNADAVAAVAIDRKGMFASLSNGNELKVHMMPNRLRKMPNPIVKRGHRKEITTVAVKPNTPHVATGSADGIIYLWNILNTRDTIATAKLNDESAKSGNPSIRKLSWSPDGSVLCAGYCDGRVAAWSINL